MLLRHVDLRSLARVSLALSLSCARSSDSPQPSASAPANEKTLERTYTPTGSHPAPGRYRLLQDFAIRDCVKYGGGWEGSSCLEYGTHVYKTGDVIAVEKFFWDKRAKEWGAKVVPFHSFQAIPVGILERVGEP